MPYGTRAPKEIEHHLSALPLCRPVVSATWPCEGAGMRVRGCVTGDHLPFRGLAAPDLVQVGRAIPMASAPSVPPLDQLTCQAKRPAVSSPSYGQLGFETPQPPRPANFCTTRETLITQQPNVYSVKHRF